MDSLAFALPATAGPPDLATLERLHREHVEALQAGTERALRQAGWDALVLHAGTPRLRSVFDDQFWPLRLTPHYAHWLPLAVPECALVIEPGRRPTLFHQVVRDFWEGPAEPETDHFWGAFEVEAVDGPQAIGPLLPRGRRVAFVGENGDRAGAWGLADEAVNPPALVRALDALRAVKTPYELLCLAEANRRAALGHVTVRDAFLAGDPSELELHLLFLRATAQDDPETPYKNIVALGRHAATLHHVSYGRRPSGAASLLLDAGATYQGYASDVTRTYTKGRGDAIDVFAELVRRLDVLQRETCARARPGLAYEALHDASHALLAPVLRDVGLVRASDDELVGAGVTRLFFPHGLGHSLGLQTHDVGCATTAPRAENPFLRHTSPIELGQVFTIEPGCYFIEEKLAELRRSPLADRVDWRLVERLVPLGGVRVEDDVVMADGGLTNLTRAALAD